VSYTRLVGVGGIGTGLFFALEGNHDLGRHESRLARRLDVRDYCKLHIIAHYPASLLRGSARGVPFQVLPVGRVGADEQGVRLRAEMTDAGMDVRFVRDVPDKPTLLSVCFQYSDGAGGNITTSDSAAATLVPRDLDEVAAFIDRSTIVLAAPEVSLAARRRMLELGTHGGAYRIASFSSAELRGGEAPPLLALCDLVSLNQEEAAVLAGQAFVPAEAASFLDAVAQRVAPHPTLVVTAGAEGVFARSRAAFHRVPALRVPVVSTAGAGDAVLGGVVTGLAAGLPLFGESDLPLTERPVQSALDLGVCLAAVAVASAHTIPPDVAWGTLQRFVGRLGARFGPSFDQFLEAAA
jgi:sugar/nucleoside kinase (ribokinase family)